MKRYELNENEIKKVNGGYVKYEHGLYIVYDNNTDRMLAAFEPEDADAAWKFDELMNR